MSTGGDPEELDALRRATAGPRLRLDRAARDLRRTGRWFRARNPMSAVDIAAAAARLDLVVERDVAADRCVATVAAALRTADATPVEVQLLASGAARVTAAVRPGRTRPDDVPLEQLPGAELGDLAATPGLGAEWRDALHRERARRWLLDLEERLATVPPPPTTRLDRLVDWVDRRVVDLVSPVVDLHVDHDEAAALLRAEAAGLRWLLDQPDLVLLDLDVGPGGPGARVALGAVDAAATRVVLVPGTGTGLHQPRPTVRDARRLHRATTAHLDDDVATIADLHAAPPDLGRAADPALGVRLGAALGAFLADLPPARTTLVGHSHGAVVAARATDHHDVDALVLLGAPGVGVLDRTGLPGAGTVHAVRAPDDPIAAVADLDELVAALPADLVAAPLRDPLALHGPDPTDPDFGARLLPAVPGPDDDRVGNRGHVDYLAAGTVVLDEVARVAAGVAGGAAATAAGARAASRRRRGVRPATPTTPDRRGSAAAD